MKPLEGSESVRGHTFSAIGTQLLRLCLKVVLDDLFGRSILNNLSLFKPSNPGTIAFEKLHAVGDNYDGFVGFKERLDTALGFATKPLIANREDLVDE